ncbi:small ubiquitin-related modifier [Drosophila takahashii]|uniref:small ubiquitin-related modifier n=1 Tax=Drosophila takahashii TaxID=29030 RepID=UPI001CF8B9EE|nr:small ubiquitin-related modifier [Drosophila takahashii]
MANQSKSLWLRSSNGQKLQCQVNTDQPLVAFLKNKYALAMGTSPESLIMVFDGEKIQEQDTFDSLALDDDDIIDVYEAN